MRIIRRIAPMQKFSISEKLRKRTIGFVPTMGFLHEGHLSLVRRSKKDNDLTVVSIFVNPKQFLPNEDFKKYPRDPKRDEHLLSKEKVDILFCPSENEMYPARYLTYVNVEEMAETLCGRFRPGHFKGVTTVVCKLLNIVQPTTLYLGQKDAQQAVIIKKMIQDLKLPVRVNVLPTVREADGLAMSSRNIYLSGQERKEAVVLFKSLKHAENMITTGQRNPQAVKTAIETILSENRSTKIDYIECVDAETLLPVEILKGSILITLAVWFGKTRLIDNIKLHVQ